MKGNNPESKAAIKEIFNHSDSDSDHEHNEKQRFNSGEESQFDYNTLSIKDGGTAPKDEKTAGCWSGLTSCLSSFFCCGDDDDSTTSTYLASRHLYSGR